ncbi:MAG TPA: hypothetical protein VED46_03705 [Alphaproteobacteria bacterium]|nr:hypothetical protein [Alphaproteobacteria bacterium]
MSGCRAERLCLSGLSAVLLLTLQVAAAGAQTGAPTPLFPAQPDESTPPPQASPGVVPPASSATKPTAGSIEATPLEEIVNDAIGPLEGPDSLGQDLWRGTSRSLAEALIPQIPSAGSPAARGLARRLLLTSARPPEGSGSADLILLRADRLLGLGYAGDAAELRSLAPVGRMDAIRAGQLADALLLAGRINHACALIDQNAAFAADPAGERLSVLCALHIGDRDRAYFLFDLMREQDSADPTLGAAIAIADGATDRSLPEDARPTPFLLAMLAEGKAAPPDRWLGSAEPAYLPALLALPVASETRVAAAERAARLALLDPAVLAAAYQGLKIETKEREAAAASPRPETPRRRVALHQAVQQTADPIARARLVRQALEFSRADPLLAATARLHAPFLRALAPVQELAGSAPTFARALFLAGDPEAARRWVALARANAADPGIAARLPGLALLSALAGETLPAWNQVARTFLERPAPTPEGARLAAVARLLPLDAGAVQPGAAPPAGGFFDPGLGLALRNAAAARRVGETVLFALIAIGDGGPASTDAGALAEALTALRRIGLEAEVRDLAIEAAIANGA